MLLQKSSVYKLTGLIFILFLLLTACNSGNDNSNSSGSNENTASEPSGCAKTAPEPEAGKGNLCGKILWNGTGAGNLDLILCQDFSSFSGCGGPEQKSQTNEDGTYLFQNMPPGTYALSVRVFDTNDWLYISGGILSSYDFEITAGDTLDIPIQNIFKLDVQPTNPKSSSEISPGAISLAWEKYTDAAYYEVYLTPDSGDTILVNQRIETNEYEVKLPPVNCLYRWSIKAYNSNNVEIAETNDYFEFSTTGADASCHLKLNTPSDGGKINGDHIQFGWESHPLADTYQITVQDADDSSKDAVLSFESTSKNSYDLSETLPPARYIWWVGVYDVNGKKLAESDVYDFTVEK